MSDSDERKDELSAWRQVLDSPSGRRVLATVLRRCGTMRQSFDLESERLSTLRAGERSIGLWLLARVDEARPDETPGMIALLQKPHGLTAEKGDRIGA